MKTEYEKVLLPSSVQQELENLRTQAIADAAEVARLQGGFDDLKQWVEREKYDPIESFQIRYIIIADDLMDEINRITGVEQMQLEEIRKGAHGATHYNTCVRKLTKQGGHLMKDWVYWDKGGWHYLCSPFLGFNKPL